MRQLAEITINLSALQHNLQIVRQQVGKHRKIVAMIKADAYGHGLVPVANALSAANALGVARLEEAAQLREVGITKPIILMSGFSNKDELEFIISKDINPVIHDPHQLTILQKTQYETPLPVWIKIDSGMHRLGIQPGEFADFYEQLNQIDYIQKPIGLMTHLADADNDRTEFTLHQLDQFKQITHGLPGLKSVGNSAAILAYQEHLTDMVRPGIMLYGISPFADQVGRDFGLQPAMTLSSKIIAIKTVKAGEKIGYGCTWTCPEEMPIAVVALGYGDGYPRHAINGTPVLINNIQCPIVGRVSMDLITVDLRPVPSAKLDGQVIFWGEDLPVEVIAKSAGTIAYELVCSVTSRVKLRQY